MSSKTERPDDEERLVVHSDPVDAIEELDGEDPPSPDGSPLPLAQTNIPRVCCALLASLTTGGVTYAFGLYGNALKKNLHLTQGQLETMSTATFCAGLFSWIPGMFVDRFGTRLGISLGGITGASSLMVYWTVAKGYIPIQSTSVVVCLLSALGVVIFLSCALITGAVFKIVSSSCGAGTKGSAVGVAKGYVGLGSGAYACLFEAIRQPSASDLDFLPMCAFFFIVAATIPSALFLPTKEQERTVPDVLTPSHFQLLFSSLFILALLILGSSLMALYDVREQGGTDESPNYMLALVLVIVWLFPIAMQLFLPQKAYLPLGPTPDEQDTLLQPAARLDDMGPKVKQPLTQEVDHAGPSEASEDASEVAGIESSGSDSDDDAVYEQTEALPAAPREKNLYQMLQTSPAWLMLWTATILVGGGTVVTNNMGQMVEARSLPPIVTTAALSLFSVCQSAGRVVTGAMSETALNWDVRGCCIPSGVPRPFFLVVASLAGVFAHTTLAVSSEEASFVFGVALAGLAFGSIWPLLVLIVGEIYGTAHVAANYMFYDGFTSAAGTLLLSKIVAQQVYDRHTDDGVTCYGLQCFRPTHVVIAVLSITCILSSALAQHLTRTAYNKTGDHGHTA